MMLRTVVVGVLTWIAVLPLAARADRAVAWTTAGEAALERELNNEAARGLRLAAVSDGLPCMVTAMQAPDRPMPPASYRVVADRSLDAMLGSLTAEGFTPRFGHRGTSGRAHVIFERSGSDRAASTSTSSASVWRLVEFADLNALQPAIAAAAGEGFQARILVRYPLKSWPGLSERGLVLAAKPAGGKAREIQVVIGESRNIDAAAKTVADATAKGFSFDMLFTGSRDGSRDARRERVVVLLSRDVGATASAPQVRLERTSSFGTFGSGVPLGAAPFWDDNYVYAWSAAARRMTWASPIRLSAGEAQCWGLPLKLRIDAPRDQTSTIVGLVARKLLNGAYELVYITDQRMGG